MRSIEQKKNEIVNPCILQYWYYQLACNRTGQFQYWQYFYSSTTQYWKYCLQGNLDDKIILRLTSNTLKAITKSRLSDLYEKVFLRRSIWHQSMEKSNFEFRSYDRKKITIRSHPGTFPFSRILKCFLKLSTLIWKPKASF